MHTLNGIQVIKSGYLYILEEEVDGKTKNNLYIDGKTLAKGVDLGESIETNDDHSCVRFYVEGDWHQFEVRKRQYCDSGWTFPAPVREE